MGEIKACSNRFMGSHDNQKHYVFSISLYLVLSLSSPSQHYPHFKVKHTLSFISPFILHCSGNSNIQSYIRCVQKTSNINNQWHSIFLTWQFFFASQNPTFENILLGIFHTKKSKAKLVCEEFSDINSA